MRDLAVFLKDAPGEANAQILAFRKELEEQDKVPVHRYGTVEELRQKLDVVLKDWADTLLASKTAIADAGSTAGSS
jgi:hypothetical protein